MRGLPPLPLSSHLNYKKDDPGASGCVALRCTATKSGEIRGKGRGNVFRRGGRKREKGGGEGERDRTLSHVDVDAVYLDTDGSLNQPTASNKHHLAITHAYRRAACVRVLTNSGDKPVIRRSPPRRKFHFLGPSR